MPKSHVDENIAYYFNRLQESVHTSLWLYISGEHKQPFLSPDWNMSYIQKLSETDYERMCYALGYEVFIFAPIAAPTMLHDYIQLAIKSGNWIDPSLSEITQHVIKPGMSVDKTFCYILENVDPSLRKQRKEENNR